MKSEIQNPKSEILSTDSLYDLVEELTARLQRGEAVDLEAVLAAHPEHSDRLRQVFPALEIFADLQSASSNGATGSANLGLVPEPIHGVLGDFRIMREVGRGGMGVVYEAEQISLDRRVALKVLPFAGVLDARQLQRFKNESRAAAGLHHTNIVPVFAVGCERGVHFYAMQFIEGQTLADVVRELRAVARRGRQPPDGVEAVERVEESKSHNICKLQIENCKLQIDDSTGEARAQAREIRNPKSEIPNRDSASTFRLFNAATLSTSSTRFRTIADWGIQVAEALDYAHSVGVIHRDVKPANLMLDSQGRVWITDFGLAQFETDAGLTVTGDILGTLRYMSPEQALGERGLVDQRTDVYSLGAALYELLTLGPIFGDAKRRELLHHIAAVDPVPPRDINCAIPAELETIVHKAMEKEPAARYTTARDLADDLRRFLHEQPIKARPATRLDKCKKWMRRNPLLARISVAFMLAAVVGMTAAAVLIDHERQQTRLEQQGRATDQRVAAAAREHVRINRYVTNINLAERAWKNNDFASARQYLHNCAPNDGEEDLRSFEWRNLWRAIQDVAADLVGHAGEVYCVRPSPDGVTLATSGQDGVRIWDYAALTELAHLTAHNNEVNGVAFSPDGKLLATAGDDHTAKIWDTTDWREVQTIPHIGEVVGTAFTPDGRLLATAERHYPGLPGERVGEDVVRLWDVATWEPRGVLRGHSEMLQSLAISDDGVLLASGSTDGTACLWDIASSALRHRLSHRSVAGSAAGVQCVAFAHRRPLLVTAGSDGTVNLWRIPDGAHEAKLTASGKPLEGVAFAPDDSAIVAVGHDQCLYVWEATAAGGYLSHQTFRSRSRLWSAAFVDQTTIITGEQGGLVQRWDCLRTPDRYRIPRLASPFPDFAFSPDGKSLLVAASDLRLFNLANQSEVTQLAPPDSPFLSVAYSPDGKSVVSGEHSGNIITRDPESLRVRKKLVTLSGAVTELKYIAGGRKLAAQVAYSGAGFKIVDAPTGSLLDSPISAVNPPDREVFVDNCDSAVALWADGMLEVWKGVARVRQIPRATQWIECAMTADSRRIAGSFQDGTIHIWSEDDDELAFVGDSEAPLKLAFSPDGRTLAGVTTGNRLKLWNLATGRELLVVGTGLAGTFRLAFSPDGSALAVSGPGISGQGEVIVWQTESPD